MLLPVNGNGFYRREDGIVGNMDSFDAARLALDCGTGLLIPMHFDLYRGNSVPESAVRDIISAAAPSVRTVFPKPERGAEFRAVMRGLRSRRFKISKNGVICHLYEAFLRGKIILKTVPPAVRSVRTSGECFSQSE